MGQETLKQKIVLNIWKMVSKQMWQLGYGKIWMINFIDKL